MIKTKRKYIRHQGSNPPGYPSKKRNLNFEIAYNLAKTGHTYEEIAEIVGIGERTLYDWIESDEKFSQALKKGEPARINRLKNSLYHRGLGYSHPSEEIHIVAGEIVRVPITKQYPPDTAAAFIYLKNKDPENWKDRNETKIDVVVNLTQDLQTARSRVASYNSN